MKTQLIDLNSSTLAVKRSTYTPSLTGVRAYLSEPWIMYRWLETKQFPGSHTWSVLSLPPSLSSWKQQSLTRGGSGGASLLWVPTFTGLHPPLPFSLTCLLLLTTPILSESTQQISDVSRSAEPLYGRAPPKLLPGDQLERLLESGW